MGKESQIYVIYDQFHWGMKGHIEIAVKGWSEALRVYAFLKECNPDESLGLCEVEKFNKLKTDIYGRD